MMKKVNKGASLAETLLILKLAQLPVNVMETTDLLERVTTLADARRDMYSERLMELFKKTKAVMKTASH